MAQTEYAGCIPLLTNDVVVAINTTQSMGDEREVIDVRAFADVALWLRAVGAVAACAADVTFYLQASPDGTNYWTDVGTYSVTLSGATRASGTDALRALDLRGLAYIRLDRVANAETVAGRTATVNAYIQRTNDGGR